MTGSSFDTSDRDIAPNVLLSALLEMNEKLEMRYAKSLS